MKIVVYFKPDEKDAALKAMIKARAEGHSVHWADALQFQAPRDLEYVDEVLTVSRQPAIERAYAERKVKVTVLEKARPPKAQKAQQKGRGVFSKASAAPATDAESEGASD